jgi:hypothetical protein
VSRSPPDGTVPHAFARSGVDGGGFARCERSGASADVRAVANGGPATQDRVMRIGFTGFAGDCIISGLLDLDGDRLTDHLNAHPSLTLVQVALEGLNGGRVDVETFEIERSQLCAAIASGPRGAPSLRVPTAERRIQAQIGPYTVLGRYHGRVGDTSLRSFSERAPMVPLTDATIAYLIDGILEVRDAGVLIINRDLAAWYREPDEAEPLVETVSRSGVAPAPRRRTPSGRTPASGQPSTRSVAPPRR